MPLLNSVRRINQWFPIPCISSLAQLSPKKKKSHLFCHVWSRHKSKLGSLTSSIYVPAFSYGYEVDSVVTHRSRNKQLKLVASLPERLEGKFTYSGGTQSTVTAPAHWEEPVCFGCVQPGGGHEADEGRARLGIRGQLINMLADWAGRLLANFQ